MLSIDKTRYIALTHLNFIQSEEDNQLETLIDKNLDSKIIKKKIKDKNNESDNFL